MFQGATSLNFDSKSRLSVPLWHRGGAAGDRREKTCHNLLLIWRLNGFPETAIAAISAVRFPIANVSALVQVGFYVRRYGRKVKCNMACNTAIFNHCQVAKQICRYRQGRGAGHGVLLTSTGSKHLLESRSYNVRLHYLSSTRGLYFLMEQVREHLPVLLTESVQALITDTGGRYLDATFGRGGHSRAILERLSDSGRLLAFDRDHEAARAATEITDPRFSFRQTQFSALASLATSSLSGILIDLGVSSPQIDDPQRGFSFRADGPLDMRMDPSQGMSAADWLSKASEQEIATVIHEYGEERFARRIAHAIVTRRKSSAVTRTLELANLVAGAVKTREPGQHPATRTFQAIRIFINAELTELVTALQAALSVLAPNGRLAVISFHSLEDRPVKQFIAAHSRAQVDRRAPFAPPPPMLLESIARIKPSDAEIEANPRSRSAILRVAQRTDVPYAARLGVQP
jgi:16S rRNA (cytosine1402-N4)-methyltransferase